MEAETIKWLTVEEVRRLLKAAKAASKRDHAILLLAYRHGLRASEIGDLRREQVDFVNGRIRIKRLKGSMGGDQPMAADERAALRAYLKEREDGLPDLFLSREANPISRSQLHVLMGKYGEAARLPADRRHFHVLKHSIAMHMIAAGSDVIFVKDWLGHRNIQNTLVYAQLRSPRRDAEMAALLTSREIA